MRKTPPSTGSAEVPLIDRIRAATKGKYEIHAELGVGGMATVFKATEIALEREVAIKVMSAAMASSPGSVERFRREARVAAALSHPHIVPIYAIGEDPSLAYFAMKFIEGRGLDSILKKDGAQPVDVVVKVITVVAKALQHAHTNGVVHRDIKPANIMVGADDWVYVTDFGIAKREDVQGLTQAGSVVGTPAYMSPEQFNGAAVTGAADQYSLGIVAYEMLAGRTPFDAPSLGEIMKGHLLDAPPPLRTARIDVPVALAECINRMLEKEPAARFASLGEAVEALEAATAGVRPGAARRPMPPGLPAMNPHLAPTTPIPRSDPQYAATTPIPRSNAAAVRSGTMRQRTLTEAQPVVEEPKRAGGGIIFFVLLLLAGGAGAGWYFLKDRIAPVPQRASVADSAPPVATTAAADPATTSVNTPNALDTAAVPGADTTKQVSIDDAVADLNARLVTAVQIDQAAPKDSVIVRVGSQMPQTVLFVNDQQVGVVGGMGLVQSTIAAGSIRVAVKRLNCVDWDTTFTSVAGRRYTFVERSPRCP